MTPSEQLTFIQEAFAPSQVFPSLMFSTSTKCWYVSTSTDVFIRIDNADTTICEHEKTLELALESYIKRLNEAEFFYVALISQDKTEWYPIRFKKWDETSQTFISIPTQDGYTMADDFVLKEMSKKSANCVSYHNETTT
ncbi:MAG: hypothetical protein EKK63_10915 [Acinetobacter sp.]|uniref:hypothetical protein n=1 Tax=Acinetobacter sp. TaxID=472 RepID=UPI000FAC9089|nr:hypothetical protein [Acinetobacter sp.]RUP38877.1 MAG: hypothetical protein EKK63_10915 [Acinetobacter sp.]